MILAKGIAIFGLQRILRPGSSGMLESLLASWLVLQVALMGGLMILSVFTVLKPSTYWALLLVVAGTTLAIGLRRSAPALRPGLIARLGKLRDDPPLTVAALGGGGVLAALGLRAMFFYDGTDDALYYGLSRIAYWYQHASILAFAPTRAVHLFIFDWNAELNGLQYFLATGRDQAIGFGNVEVWAVFVLTIVFCFRCFRAAPSVAMAGGVLFACTPAAVFLSMTVKGDLLAATGSLLGLIWTVRALRPGTPAAVSVWAIGALAYAIGGKLSCAPLAGPLILAHLFILARKGSRSPHLLAWAVVLAGLGGSHYVLNYLHYGSPLPFPEAMSGPARLTFDHFLSVGHGLLVAAFARGLDLRVYYAVNAGCGLLAFVAISFGIAASVDRNRVPGDPERWVHPRALTLLVLLFGGSLVYVMASFPWFSWSFRYFLPWVLPVFLLPLLVFFSGGDSLPRPQRWAPACYGLLFLGLLHFYAAYRPSEMIPGDSLSLAFRRAAHSTALERKLMARPDLLAGFQPLLDHAGWAADARQVLILSSVSDFIFPYFGDNASNQVALADSDASLVRLAATRRFDLVAVTQSGLIGTESVRRLVGAGYHEVNVPAGFGRVFLANEPGG